MGEALDALSGKLGLDTTDFKTGVSAANRELRVLETGFRASTASLGDWSKNATGLEARMKTLTSSIDIQKAKVAANKEEWERIKATSGENSRAAQELEIKLNKETESLGKQEKELQDTETALKEMKSGSDEAGKSVKETGDKSQESTGKVNGWGTAIKAAGVAAKAAVAAIAAVATAAIAAGAAVIGMALNAASAADDLMDLSVKTGYSTTQLQEMKYAGEILGTDLDTITSANAKLIRSMDAAKSGTGDQADAFKSLGISVVDANGNLRSSQDVFGEAIDALGEIENPTERDAAAMALMGKSAQELNPLIAAGSDEFKRLSDEAHTMGAVVDEEAVTSAANFQDKLDGLKMGLSGVGMTLGAAFLPGLSGVLDGAKGYMGELVGIISGSGGDFGKMASGMGGLITTIAKDIATQAPKMMSAGLAIVQSLLTAIMGALPSMIEAAMGIITMLINFLVQNLPMLIGAAIQIIQTLLMGLLQQIPTLIAAAIQIIITLIQGITQMLPTLIPTIIQILLTVVQTLIQNLPMLIEAALALILALADGIIAALPILIQSIPTIVISVVDAIIQALPMIATAAIQLLIALGMALIENIPLLLVKVGEVIQGLIDKFKETDWNQIGTDLIKGISDGFLKKWEDFKTNVVDNFKAMVDMIKKLLGIESPSKVFFGIGSNMALGLGSGFTSQFKDVEKNLSLAFGGLAMSAAGSGAGMSMSNQNENYTFYAPLIFQSGSDNLASTIKSKRF